MPLSKLGPDTQELKQLIDQEAMVRYIQY